MLSAHVDFLCIGLAHKYGNTSVMLKSLSAKKYRRWHYYEVLMLWIDKQCFKKCYFEVTHELYYQKSNLLMVVVLTKAFLFQVLTSCSCKDVED